MKDNKKVLSVKSLNIHFDTLEGKVNVVNNIGFHINEGETLGVVGESGCGKSLTALSIMRLVQSPPGHIKGEINFHGKNLLNLPMKKMSKIRGNKISMIFQEPMTSLNPVISIGNQLEEVFRIHQKSSRTEARKKAIEALEMVKIAMPEQRINEYPHQLSGGMRQRVMIAMALSCRPELLIADEPTTALDVTIQAQILELMRDLKKDLGTAIMLITHDLAVVAEICSRAIIIYCGQIVEEAPVSLLFSNPLHPYTEGLLRSLPTIGVRKKLDTIPGSVPGAKDFPEGCVFNPRCEYATDKCRVEVPPMVDIGEGHYVKCWLRTDRGMEV